MKRQKRGIVIPLRLSTQELLHLKQQSQLAGLSREEFLRRLIMSTEIRAKPCTHHADLLRKLAGLCNNANQLAHMANSTGQAGQHSVDEMLRIANAVFEEVQQRW